MPDRVVTPDEEGARLDVLVAGWLDEPRGRAQQRVADGQVVVDGRPVAKSHRLRAGERISVRPPARRGTEPPAPPVPVRYADEHIAVVAKPANLVVHPGAGTGSQPTLVAALRAMGLTLAPGDDPQRPGIVHRLDRGTSGLLVVARSERARSTLVETFKRHDVDRRYWAMVDGVPQPLSATVDAPIIRSARNRTKFTVAPEGRPAVTHYDVVEPRGRASVVTARLETGRTHQVRVHLSAVGHPVAGDSLYGASPAVQRDLGLRRPALHAVRLAFAHPVTGSRVELEEPLPGDLTAALERLRQLG